MQIWGLLGPSVVVVSPTLARYRLDQRLPYFSPVDHILWPQRVTCVSIEQPLSMYQGDDHSITIILHRECP